MNANGTIHAVPVWYSYIDGKFIIATPVSSHKARNVKRNENVTLLVDDSGTRGVWPKGVVVYGKAKVDTVDLDLGEFTLLCQKYFQGDRAKSYASGLLSLARWVKIVVTPQRMVSFDYTKDESYKRATGE
jgi:hypothetical protein